MPLTSGVTTTTARFAEFIRQASATSLPPAVETAARRAFANWIACALGATHDRSVCQLFDFVSQVSGRGAASIVGRSERVDPVNAALTNGVAANALDYDDMHTATLIHPTGPVVAAALALSEVEHARGDLLVRSIVAGVEVECRLGLMLFPAHYDSGWHITATLGTFGAAAAACVVLGLTREQTQHALGIASTLCGGLRAMLSNSCKSLNIGKAAADGVRAALLAQAGFDSEPDALEAKFGFFHVFGPGRNVDALTAELGARYLISDVSLKPYPCGIVIHPLIDACIEIAKSAELKRENVRRVTARVHPRAVELADCPRPDTALAARYSLQYAAALALSRRSAGLADFENARLDEPALVYWRDRIVLKADATLSTSQARVDVELANGRRIEHAVDHPSGSAERPMSDTQLESKFVDLATRVLDERTAKSLYDVCCNVQELADVSELRRHWVDREMVAQ